MSSVSANYTMPTILDSLSSVAGSGHAKAASAKANASTSSTSSSDSSSSTGIGSTFLSLLAQELQNQDPTAPMDSTAMVGQMISLNQLDQLISINEAISASSTTSGTTTNAAKVAGTTASTAAITSASGATSTLSPSAAAAAAGQLPFDPNTMMPLGFGNTSTAISSPYSTINAAPIGFSGSANKTSGGK
jgi:flagellar basal-body rod modification protein FlgD